MGSTSTKKNSSLKKRPQKPNAILEASCEIKKIFDSVKSKKKLNSGSIELPTEKIRYKKIKNILGNDLHLNREKLKPIRFSEDGLPVYRLEDIDFAIFSPVQFCFRVPDD
ncbi:Kinesin-like protein KIF22 [Cryptosporidium felis]|nr:Kinesin-like protein KIF22 [Cryptosporidium felis]